MGETVSSSVVAIERQARLQAQGIARAQADGTDPVIVQEASARCGGATSAGTRSSKPSSPV